MKHEFIYLDWNVVKDLKDGAVDPLFQAMIETLKTKYIIPFSFAHLCDRQKKMNLDTIKFIKDDLEFFNILSNGYMLGRFEDDYDIDNKSIFQKFDEVTKSKFTQYPIPIIPQDVLERVKKIGFSKFFEDKQNVSWFPLMVFSALNRFECDFELYKQFRETFKMDAPKEIDFFNDLQKVDISSNELRKVTDKFIQANQSGDKILREEMRTAYLLLDFNHRFHEKINSKSNFTNIYTDSEHMLNASFAKYYITKDKKTIKKTKLIYDAYGIKTEIYTIKDFIKAYSI